MTRSTVRFRVLGPLSVLRDGEPVTLPSGQVQLLLEVLLVHAGRTVSVDGLMAALWDVDFPASARKLIQVRMSQLRRALAGTPAELTGSRAGYRLEIPERSLDLDEFRRLVRAAAGRPAQTAEDVLRQALQLWRGPALSALGDTAWGARVVTGLREEYLAAALAHADAALACGRHADLVTNLAPVVAEHPLHERLRARLMHALHRMGRQAEALAVYDEGRRLLADELGIDPSAQLRAAHAAILAGDAETDAAQGESGEIPAQLPVDLRGFAGRAHELARLDAMVPVDVAPAAVAICTVSGTAGVGKTAMAVHWAHRVAHRFPDGQLYVNLRGFDPERPPMSPAEAIRGFLDALGVASQRIPVELDAQAALYRSRLAGRRMLVLLDNAADADQVRPLLPGAPGCLVVTTSRDRLAGLTVTEGAVPLNLALPDVGEARQLLINRLGADRVHAEPEAVEQIIARCARLPLALAVVAARAVSNPGFPLAALADDLRIAERGLDAFDSGDLSVSVRAVLSWSYQRLSGQAARLFRLLGVHSGPDIGVRAAACLAGVTAAQVRPQLAELARAHLVTEPQPGRFARHDLLRRYASELARAHDPAADRAAALHRMLDYYLHTAHAADRLLRPHRDPIAVPAACPGVVPDRLAGVPEALTWFSAEQAVLVAAIEQAASQEFEAHAWRLATTLSDYLGRAGRWHVQQAVQHIALTAASRQADRTGQAHAHFGLGQALAWLGSEDAAAAHYGQARELFGELGNQVGQAHVELGLGLMCQQRGRAREAFEHTTAAYALFRIVDHPAGQGNALNNIGWLHAQRGQYPQALSCCRAALRLLDEIGDRYGQANAMDSIGYINHQLGNHQEAIAHYERALDRFHEVGEEYYVADTLAHLGAVHADTGDPESARQTWRRSLDILDRLRHPEAEQVRTMLRDLPVHR